MKQFFLYSIVQTLLFDEKVWYNRLWVYIMFTEKGNNVPSPHPSVTFVFKLQRSYCNTSYFYGFNTPYRYGNSTRSSIICPKLFYISSFDLIINNNSTIVLYQYSTMCMSNLPAT